MQTIRLALIRQHYNPFGGAERFVQRALEALGQQAGVSVTVFARQWSGALPANVRVVQVPVRSKVNFIRDAQFRKGVLQRLDPTEYDIIQSHERLPGVQVYRAGDGVHAAWLRRRGAQLSLIQRWAMWLNPYHFATCRAEKAMFESSALKAVICNSKMVRDEIAQCFQIDPGKLVLLYNGIDCAAFKPADPQQRRAARVALGLSQEIPLMLYLGSGFERKGLAYALQAMAQVARHQDPGRLLVVGHDKHAARYQTLASGLGLADRVQFAGPLKDVSQALAAADGFVLPTVYDPFPNAALEALACGVPVLVSDACGTAEWVRNGVEGWVHACGDVQGLAHHWSAWLASAEGAALQNMRLACRDLALRHTQEDMKNQLMNFYAHCMGEAASEGRPR